MILVHLESAPDFENLAISRSQGRVFERGARRLDPRCDQAVFEAVFLRSEIEGPAAGLLVCEEQDVGIARRALAMGLDRVFLLVHPGARSFDGFCLARIVSKATAKLGARAIVFGAAASDGIEAEVSFRVSERMRMPVVTPASARRSLPLPCVVRARPGLHSPRLPSAIDIVRAARKEIVRLTAPELGLSEDELVPRILVRSVSLAEA